jgi:hypothetical protein
MILYTLSILEKTTFFWVDLDVEATQGFTYTLDKTVIKWWLNQIGGDLVQKKDF